MRRHVENKVKSGQHSKVKPSPKRDFCDTDIRLVVESSADGDACDLCCGNSYRKF